MLAFNGLSRSKNVSIKSPNFYLVSAVNESRSLRADEARQVEIFPQVGYVRPSLLTKPCPIYENCISIGQSAQLALAPQWLDGKGGGFLNPSPSCL